MLFLYTQLCVICLQVWLIRERTRDPQGAVELFLLVSELVVKIGHAVPIQLCVVWLIRERTRDPQGAVELFILVSDLLVEIVYAVPTQLCVVCLQVWLIRERTRDPQGCSS